MVTDKEKHTFYISSTHETNIRLKENTHWDFIRIQCTAYCLTLGPAQVVLKITCVGAKDNACRVVHAGRTAMILFAIIARVFADDWSGVMLCLQDATTFMTSWDLFCSLRNCNLLDEYTKAMGREHDLDASFSHFVLRSFTRINIRDWEIEASNPHDFIFGKQSKNLLISC